MKATLVKDLPVTQTGASQKLWKLDEPYTLTDWDGRRTGETEYVITSAVCAMFDGPETYVFAADENGEVVGGGELDGSFRGDLDHDRAIAGFCTIAAALNSIGRPTVDMLAATVILTLLAVAAWRSAR